MGVGSGGDGYVYEAVVALAGIAHEAPVFEGRKVGYAASAQVVLGVADAGGCNMVALPLPHSHT